MKVRNMTSSKGNKVANQFIIKTGRQMKIGAIMLRDCEIFQSYDSAIAMKAEKVGDGKRLIFLDSEYWDYSKTTGKYRNIFLGESKAETQKKIDSGEYILTNLN